MSDHVSQMRTNKESYDRKVDSIRNHTDLSADAKRRYVAEAYEEAAAFRRELASKHAAEQRATMDRLEKREFDPGVPKSGSVQDRMAATVAYRDALDRADRAFAAAGPEKGVQALRQLVDRAELSGDDQQGLAAYHLARKKGLHSVGDGYASDRPKMAEAWKEYTAARNAAESVEGRLFGAGSVGAFAPAKPREL